MDRRRGPRGDANPGRFCRSETGALVGWRFFAPDRRARIGRGALVGRSFALPDADVGSQLPLLEELRISDWFRVPLRSGGIGRAGVSLAPIDDDGRFRSLAFAACDF